MMKCISKCILIFGLTIFTTSCEQNLASSNPYSEGISMALAGKTPAAIKSFIKSIKNDNNINKSFVSLSVLNKLQKEMIKSHSSHFFFAALDKLSSGDINGATVNIDKAIASEFNFSEAYILRAIINQEQKDYKSSLRDYTKAISINPDKFNFVYNERGIKETYLGNFHSALDDFETAIANDQNYVAAYYNKANTQNILNNHSEAIKSYTKALSLDPNFSDALFFRANTYLDLKSYKKAIRDYDAVIKIKPDFAIAHINRGVAYSKTSGSHKLALKDFSKAIEIYPWYGLAFYNRAVTHSYLNNSDKAIADYSKAIDQDPWYTKAEVVWLGREKNKKIFTRYEYERDKTEDTHPRYSVVKSNRGIVYIYKGISDTVVSDYNKASKLYPWYAMAYFNRAVTYTKNKHYEKAISDYNKALEINPGDPEIIGRRAVAYYHKGNKEKAAEDLKVARQMGYEPDKDILKIIDTVKSNDN